MKSDTFYPAYGEGVDPHFPATLSPPPIPSPFTAALQANIFKPPCFKLKHTHSNYETWAPGYILNNLSIAFSCILICQTLAIACKKLTPLHCQIACGAEDFAV